MRIAYVLDQLERGGTETQFLRLAGAMANRGHRVMVISLRDPGPCMDSAVAEARTQRVDVRTLGSGPISRRRLIPICIKLDRFLRVFGPDVVHAAMTGSMAMLAVLNLVSTRRSLVMSRRSLTSFRRDGPVKSALRRGALAQATIVVANSAAVARDSSVADHRSIQRYSVIPNILADDALLLSGFPLRAQSDRYVVSVASLREPKGQEILLKALAELQQAHHNVRAVLVGDGPRRKELQDLAISLGLDVTFTGLVEDPGAYLRTASVYVQSSFAEGMSNALLEAMRAGLPIVATDVGGTAEALAGCGILVPAGDPQRMKEALLLLLTNEALAESYGAAARTRSIRHSAEHVAARHEIVYRAAIKARHRTPLAGQDARKNGG